MSGHSKWAQIRRQKAAVDARKGQMFTKLGREITVAAREGGPDPDANVRLRLAIQHAKEANMPMENVRRAIERATGGGESAALEEIVYEGYGPHGAAVLVEVMTDNRNRAAADVRNAFSRAGGNLGESGCVAWIFNARGVIGVQTNGRDPDEIALLAIDAGADDVKTEDRRVEIYTNSSDLERVRQALAAADVEVESAERTLIPTTTVQLDEQSAMQVLRLLDRLEDLDDVQKVYSNVDFPDDLLERYNE